MKPKSLLSVDEVYAKDKDVINCMLNREEKDFISNYVKKRVSCKTSKFFRITKSKHIIFSF